MVRGHRQARNGARHGKMAGAQDVQIINLGYGRMGNADLGHGMQFGCKGHAARLRQFLAVIQPGGNTRGVKDDGGGSDRPGKGATANLIHPGNAGGTAGAGSIFERKIGQCLHHAHA
jgi:hypothetical protein